MSLCERLPEAVRAGGASMVDRKQLELSRADPLPAGEYPMQNIVLAKLRREFIATISSDQNNVTLDPAITELRAKISDPSFIEPFSIYSRGQLREMNDALGVISNSRLKDDPLRVAVAVDEILKLFDKLELTVKQSWASNKRIEAGRSG